MVCGLLVGLSPPTRYVGREVGVVAKEKKEEREKERVCVRE